MLEDFVLVLEEIKNMRSIDVKFQTLTRRKPRPLAERNTDSVDSEVTGPLTLLLMYMTKIGRKLEDVFQDAPKSDGGLVKVEQFKTTLQVQVQVVFNFMKI